MTSSPAAEESRPARRDRSTRSAALWATLVAVPVTLAVAGFTFAKLAPDSPAAAPSPSASAARPQSSAPVELPAPALAERPATVCRALVSQLPATVRDLAQRPVTAGAEQNAAYGDPALTVACGGTPPIVQPTDEVWSVNKVCWHAVQEADATVLTTVDRETPVRVRVPKQYEQPLQWVTPISDAVVASVPAAKTAPSGCSA
ncbi:DUF3515 family protein (plasmid) [Micromonospora terminaliae]|uniref:DUF3515 family protein n=1 Tax=Micromonospora terminaliae TaxID=1914461 RepID=A0A6I5UPC4_9ACTN|nr:DUF3515 family protein [Micromonospora terminaliae]QGL51164.1 DUF3515 family protein [Micromonospora terminaliae]QGL51666.1 DUF3515 family protein [Micromonospora terminaliae]QGL51667.1 DUF3515 family protein [Micromonospora terminaliae]